MPKTKAHIQYRLKSGTLVPGTTTVLSLLAKPALVEWAYRCGREGIDIHKVRDNSADIGTLVHAMILGCYTGEVPDLSEYSLSDIAKANNSLQSFHAWANINAIKPLYAEQPLISETFGFGGTPDLCGTRQSDNALILCDFKSGKGIYDEYSIQLGAYGQLVYENMGKWPDKALILRVNTGDNDDFEVRTVSHMDRCWDLFRHLLMVYKLSKELA